MSITEFILRLAVVTVLAAYLLVKYHQRWRRKHTESPEDQWIGTSIDITPLKAIGQFRSPAAKSLRWHLFHQSFAALTRQTIANFSFFNRYKANPPG
jgi:hypothetical protein